MISYGGNECHALVDALIRGMVEKKRLHPRKVDSTQWGRFRNVLHMVIFYDLACRAANGSCRRRITVLCLTRHLCIVSTCPLQVQGEVQASHRQRVPVPSLVGDRCGTSTLLPGCASCMLHTTNSTHANASPIRVALSSRTFVQGRCTPSSTPSFVAFLRVSSLWPAPRTCKETRPRPS
jgi:hypothetical protein